jgi:hypothetical protein
MEDDADGIQIISSNNFNRVNDLEPSDSIRSSFGKSIKLIDSGFLKKRKLSSAFFPSKNSKYEDSDDILSKEIQFEAGNLPEETKKDEPPNVLDLVDEDIIQETCLMCNLNLTGLTENEKEDHLNQCLDDQGIEKSQSKTSNDPTDRGLRCAEFFCVICDVNLSKRKLLDRCLHLKRCAKDHQMSTKQLMQFISPDFENEEDDGFIEEIDGPFPRENSKTGGEVINLLSDSEEENSQELKRAQTLPPVKNALSMLMESSRQQNQLYNAGGYSENVQKKSKTLSVVNSTKPRSTKSKDATENPSTETTDVANVTTAPKPSRFNRWNKNNNNQRFGNTAKPGGSNYAPAYKKIQVGDMSYPIIVDGFQFASSLLSECYFLTHFHSDHYTGLSQDFSCGKFFYSQISSSSLSYIGNIYCTPTTASLVKLKLKVATKHLIPLELEKKVSSF